MASYKLADTLLYFIRGSYHRHHCHSPSTQCHLSLIQTSGYHIKQGVWSHSNQGYHSRYGEWSHRKQGFMTLQTSEYQSWPWSHSMWCSVTYTRVQQQVDGVFDQTRVASQEVDEYHHRKWVQHHRKWENSLIESGRVASLEVESSIT